MNTKKLEFRSTIHGEFYRRINELAGHEVISVNYLGDWGRQFALLAAHWPSSEARAEYEQLAADASPRARLRPLMRAYVEAAARARADLDFRNVTTANLHVEMERALIADEQGHKTLQLWTEFRRISVEYLREFYAELGVRFDEWDAESRHVEAATRIVSALIESGRALQAINGVWYVPNNEAGGYSVVRAQDASTLYLSRCVFLFQSDGSFFASFEFQRNCYNIGT